jgi:hypothetical protein
MLPTCRDGFVQLRAGWCITCSIGAWGGCNCSARQPTSRRWNRRSDKNPKLAASPLRRLNTRPERRLGLQTLLKTAVHYFVVTEDSTSPSSAQEKPVKQSGALARHVMHQVAGWSSHPVHRNIRSRSWLHTRLPVHVWYLIELPLFPFSCVCLCWERIDKSSPTVGRLPPQQTIRHATVCIFSG